MTQGEIIAISIGFVVDVVIIALLILKFRWSNKHFKITKIDFEVAVQEQKRNQAESDDTQLRIEEAKLKLMVPMEKEKKEWKGAMEEILYRRKQCKCRVTQTVNKIKELKKEEEELEDCGK